MTYKENGQIVRVVPPKVPPRFWMTDELQPLSDKLNRDGKLPEVEWIRYCRLRGRQDLYFFAKYLFGCNLLVSHLHAPLCWAWQRPNGDEEDGIKYGRFRLALLPRGHFKTYVLTQAYAAWRLVRNPNERILIWTHSQTFSEKVFSRIANIFEGRGSVGQFFLEVYGDLIPNPKQRKKWTQRTLTINRPALFTDASIEAGSVGSSLTGGHYTIELIDDPIDSKLSRAEMERVIDEFDNLTPMLVSLKHSERRAVMTRWAYYDLAAYIMKHWPYALVALRAAEEDGKLLLPEHVSFEELHRLKRANPFFYSCNPGEAPVLMADWTTKPIREIKVGDTVIGWAGKRRALCKTKVLAVGTRTAPVQKVVLASGAQLRCTPDHKWFHAKKNRYSPAKVGRSLVRVVEDVPALTEEQRAAAQWLAGLFDGEGIGTTALVGISQSREHNPEVCARIEYSLNLLGFHWRYYPSSSVYVLSGGRQEIRRFLLICNPARSHKIEKYLWAHSGGIACQLDKVVSIEPQVPETVYSMQTGTGNYVVWGYASKNCQFLNVPRDEDKLGFKRSWFRYFRRRGQYIYELDSDNKEQRQVNLARCNVFIIVDPNTGRTPGVHSDPNYGKRRDSDYIGIIVLAVNEDNIWYVLRAERARRSVDWLTNEIFNLVSYFSPKFVAIEQRAAQYLFNHIFTMEFKRRNKTFILRDWAGGTASKEERIQALIPRYSNGMIYHLENDTTGGTNALEEELLDFPSAKYDDLSDALSGAVPVVYSPRQLDPNAHRVVTPEQQQLARLDDTSYWVQSLMEKERLRRKYKPNEFWF